MPAKQRIASFSRDILWGVGLWVKPVGIMVDMVGPHGGIWISSSAGLNNKQPWRLGSNPLQVRFVKKLLMATRNPASLNQLDMVNISRHYLQGAYGKSLPYRITRDPRAWQLSPNLL